MGMSMQVQKCPVSEIERMKGKEWMDEAGIVKGYITDDAKIRSYLWERGMQIKNDVLWEEYDVQRE